MHTHTHNTCAHTGYSCGMLTEWCLSSVCERGARVRLPLLPYTQSLTHTPTLAHTLTPTPTVAHTSQATRLFLFASFSPALSISLNLSPFFPLLLSLMHYHLAFFPIPNVPTRKRDIPQKIVRHRMINRILRSSLSISLSIHCAYAVPIQTCQYCLLNCCYVTSLCWWSLPSFF